MCPLQFQRGSLSTLWTLQTNADEYLTNRVLTFWVAHAAWRSHQEDWSISRAGLLQDGSSPLLGERAQSISPESDQAQSVPSLPWALPRLPALGTDSDPIPRQ